MTVEQDRATVAPPRTRFMAALAVVSNGHPLEADQRAAFQRALTRAQAPVALVESLLLAASAGVLAADVPALPRAEAVPFVVALTRLAIEQAGDRPDPLAVPEAVAQACGLPRSFIARTALRVAPLVAPDTDLEAQLEAFFSPDAALHDLASHLAADLAPPRPAKRSFARISPTRYQHPKDRAGIELINGIAGFDDLTRLIFEHAFEKAFRIHNLSSCVRVSEKQFPDLYATYLEVVARVGVRPVPELYLKPGGINAHTSGVERPYVMLDAGAVGSLSPDELEFIIGHELGHIRCQHMLHMFVGAVLPLLVSVIPIAGGYIGKALELAVGDWRRKAEFSCDRVGLLACQDLESAQRVMLKFSGVPASLYSEINMEAFLEQNAEFEGLDSDVISLVIKLFAGSQSSHPWTVSRVAELKRWHDEGEYAAILADSPTAPGTALTFMPLPDLPAQAFRCAVCQTTFSLVARECPQCSAPPRDTDRVRRCAACGSPCADDTQLHCTNCSDPASRQRRLAGQNVLDGPPGERLRDVLDRLVPAVASLGLGPLAGVPLTALAAAREAAHLTVIAGERGRGQQSLVALIPVDGPATLEVAPALDGPDRHAAGAAVLPADLVLVCLDAGQLLAQQEREAIREGLLPYAVGELALVVMHLERVEDAEDRTALRDRARKFALKLGGDRPVFFPGDPDDGSATATFQAFVLAARARGTERREAVWLRKVDTLLASLSGLLAGQGVQGFGWREASASEREEMTTALTQEHRLALVQAEAVLATRFATLRTGLTARLDGLTPHALQHEGLDELVREVRGIGRETGNVYLESFERGLTARAPAPLRRAAQGFRQHAGGHVERQLGTDDADVVIEGRRDRNAMLMALTALGAGLVLLSGGVMGPLFGALSIAGAHGLRLDVNDRHDTTIRAGARATLETWLTETERALGEQLQSAAARVLEALTARVESAMAAPVNVPDAPAETPAAVLALIKQGQTLAETAGLAWQELSPPADAADTDPTHD